uniref:somatostatin receptor type 2-like n=1 Tax=Ciona intestinalis TaxID=7719 RepID=UPI000180C9D1|nr:somatostatin receptor type 2-like [Ciona intestinalis]|eukprot:XP_002124281.1 somatostatin receptor type 2-like [Ciona intestinalis]
MSSNDVLVNTDAKVAFSGVICAVGLVGNFLVMFVVLVLREFRKSVTHWYVLQLAIADSLFLISLPFKMIEDINGYWMYPEWMCKGKETLLFLNYYTSVSFLMIMSIDRYIAVCHPFSDTLQRLRKPKSAIIITVTTWVAGLLICIPVMLYSFKVGIQPNCRCTYQFPKPAIDHMASCLDNNLTLAECEAVQVHSLPEGPEQHCKSLSLGLGGGGNTPDYNYAATEATNVFSGDGASDVINNSTNDVMNNGTTNGTSDGGDYFGANEATGMSSSDGDVMYNGTSDVTNDTDGDQSYTDYNYDYTDTFTDGTPESCHYHTRAYGFKVFNIFNFVVMFILPLAVMGACYGLIIFRLTSGPLKDKSESRSGTNKSSKSEKDRRRVTIMCLCLVGCFFVCWLPFHAVHIAKIVGISGQTDALCRILPVVASLLAYSNSALNPYLYSFLGGNFAQRWKAATGSVKKSVTKAPSTSNSGVGAVHFKKKRNDNSSSQVSNTAITRLNRKSKPIDSSMDGSNTASNI